MYTDTQDTNVAYNKEYFNYVHMHEHVCRARIQTSARKKQLKWIIINS